MNMINNTHAGSRIPATIISGFLGSGKTTLLNRILQANTQVRAAVLVNDFGKINIDSKLIKNHDGKVMSLANGCICCSISDDLMGQIDDMLNSNNPPESLIIEASGVSDPGRIARILGYKIFRDRVRIDAIVNVLDASQLDKVSEDFKDLTRWQLKQADIVVINKTDLCSDKQLEQLKRDWLTPDKRVFETSFAKVPMALILGVDVHAEHTVTDGCHEGCAQQCHHHTHDESHDHHLNDQHDDIFESIAWQCDQVLEFSRLEALIKNLPKDIYRAKGIFNVGQKNTKRLVLQLVGARIDWSEEITREADDSRSYLIMIAQKNKVDFTAVKNTLDAMVAVI